MSLEGTASPTVEGAEQAPSTAKGSGLELTGLSKGAVPPFGRLFGLRTIYDESLLDVDRVNFNAGSHTNSVSMRREDMIRVGGGQTGAFSTR